MAALEKLIEYRKTYLNRAEEKINHNYLSMIDEAIEELSTTQHRLHRLEKIYSGIDGRYVDSIIDLPDVVFDKFLDYCLDRELSLRDINELARLIIVWENKTEATIQEYHSIKFYKQLLNTQIPPEAKTLAQQIITDFEERLNILVDPYDEPAERIESIKNQLRNKYIKYLLQ